MIFINIKNTDEEKLAKIRRGASTKAYKTWRAEVLKRDEYRCQFPGCGGTSKLCVHHIKKSSSRKDLQLELWNGITLCENCHVHKVNKREEKYEIMFMIMALKNMGLIKDKNV